MPVQKSGDKRKRSTAETDGTYVCQCHSNFKNVTYVIAHFEFIFYITVLYELAQVKHGKICDMIKSVLEATTIPVA